MYLMWFDDNNKKSVAQKIAEGAAAYAERMGYAPTVAITSEGERCEVEGLQVVARGYVRPHNFWLGMEVPQ
jgi:hypothetical protein